MDEREKQKKTKQNKTKKTTTSSKCKSVVYSREVVGAGAFPAFLHLIIIPARIAARLFSLSLSLLSLSFFAAVSVSSELSSNTTSPSSAVFNSQKSRRKKKTKKKTYKETLSLIVKPLRMSSTRGRVTRDNKN